MILFLQWVKADVQYYKQFEKNLISKTVFVMNQ